MSLYINTHDTPYLRLEVHWTMDLPMKRSMKSLFSPLPDVDTGIVMVRKDHKAVDESYYGQLASKDGGIQHHADENQNAPIVPDPYLRQEQYDLNFYTLNNAITSFSLAIFSSAPLNGDNLEQKVTSLNYKLVYPAAQDEELVIFEKDCPSIPDTTGVHIATCNRLSSHEWQVDSFWQGFMFSNIREFHNHAEIASTGDLKENMNNPPTTA